jgi:acetolactate synthase-1/2/3 large subunit
MALPVTKASWKVERCEDLPNLLANAFSLAVEGRPGPVLVDIPMDVQRSNIETGSEIGIAAKNESPVSSAVLESLYNRIKSARHPLILAGGGIRSGRVCEMFRRFVDAVQIPVVNSLMAVDALPYEHPLRVGLIGTYGNRWANLALSQSDLLIVLGSRLDVRQTGSNVEAFKGNRLIYQIDCDCSETNNRVTGCEIVVSTLSDFLNSALRELPASGLPRRDDWINEIAKLRARWPDDKESTTAGINPNRFIHALSRRSAGASAFVVDVGQHQMWAAQSTELAADQRFLTSGGMGSMGFALPASIGVAASDKKRPVVAIAGDGGFQCNIQELQTIVRNRFPIKMVILNNHCHGMVRQFQKDYFDARYQSTLWGYSAPHFSKVAQAYGIAGRVLTSPSETDAALEWLWAEADSPALLDVQIDQNVNAYPKIAFGRPITEMEPLVTTD